jgi:putative restriction endonuclease
MRWMQGGPAASPDHAIVVRIVQVHVSERLLMLHDGPLLAQSLKAMAGTTMRLPRRREHLPDRDRLAIRFEQFKRVA